MVMVTAMVTAMAMVMAFTETLIMKETINPSLKGLRISLNGSNLSSDSKF